MRTDWIALAIVLTTALTPVAIAAQTAKESPKEPARDTIRGGDHIHLPSPPAADAIPVVDNYYGTKITDNYRWLEDAKSAETRDFLDKQIAYTDRYLKQAKVRPEFADNLDALVHVTTWTTPIQRGDSYFFTKRLSGEEQPSIFMRHGWAASSAVKSIPKSAKQTTSEVGKDIRLIDPASLSRDPNTSVSLLEVSQDGSLLIYGVREGGADEEEVHIFNVKTRKSMEDSLPAERYQSVDFAPDLSGVYYSRFTHKGCLVYLHKFGTRPSSDILVFGREFRGEPLAEMDLISAKVTDDGHYLAVTISRGVPAKRVDIVFRDLKKPGNPFDLLIWGTDSRFAPLYSNGDWFVRTDYKAPNGRILRAIPGGVAPDAWETIVPEGPDVLDGANIVGNKLFVHRLKDVKSETTIYTLQGKATGAIQYDGIGDASVVSGSAKDRYGFYSFQSFIQPPTIYRYDTTTGKREIFAQPKTPFDSSEYELKQVFYKSKDGTRIPMFVAGKKGLKTDGSERLLMTGYGGFNLSETPDWNPLWAAWMAQGGWFALPNLRGGGEYGEAWHEQGMFAKKQNVFDDFYAAAEYLIANHYTSAAHFAISGRSNGGLLMGAAMTQRPDLFGAIWCGYPLLDMLRYQSFELGRLWTAEYGSAENEKDFPYIRKYSPYQNVKPDTAYPAIMFFTGDSDTRVDPLHARKMTALMQTSSSSGRPVLLHYSLKSGHSAGVSAAQLIDDYADQLAFLWTETGPR
ncbi:prolyl oligopeptidase family serine peptidase [Acidicapsa acidisoli]|uniref:prolyl oligopeptidase family serine peptidase n=1 Tax=Acidicapsa acidisoli TaxID=1615681 RepID=UPI0021DFBA42|nr:prolyl oligopeptidase family serine peptidase [Acidicapsa acidisoli]